MPSNFWKSWGHKQRTNTLKTLYTPSSPSPDDIFFFIFLWSFRCFVVVMVLQVVPVKLGIVPPPPPPPPPTTKVRAWNENAQKKASDSLFTKNENAPNSICCCPKQDPLVFFFTKYIMCHMLALTGICGTNSIRRYWKLTG